MYKKVTTTTTEEYSDMPLNGMSNGTSNVTNMYSDCKAYMNCIRVDIPLMIRLLEYAREEASKDADLHLLTENMIDMSANGRVLTMNDFENIIETATTPIVGTV